MTRQDLYYRMPVLAQNALVSAYGWHLRRKRYGHGFADVWRSIEAARSWDPEQIAHYQGRQLAVILKHCAEQVPFYSNRPQIGLEALAELPVLDKESVRQRGPELLARGARPYWTQHTSGSSGTPVVVHLDRATFQLSHGLLTDHERSAGISRDDKRATFAGRLVQPVRRTEPPFWRYNRAERQMLFSAYHLSDLTLPSYLEALNRFEPAEIIGYPSAIYVVADYLRRSGKRLDFQPRVVITNSETLFEWQRELIQTTLGCPVRDYYGSAESVAFAGQCQLGSYHFNPLLGIVEIADAQGRPVAAGQQGTLLCTTLSNFVMPLVRYAIGDDAIRSADCPCGSAFPAAGAIIGRSDDNIVTPDGRPIGRLDHIFKGMVGIRECQLVQETAELLLVRVVADDTFGQREERTLVDNLLSRVGEGLEIRVQRVEQIKRTDRGKFKGVVNLVTNRRDIGVSGQGA